MPNVLFYGGCKQVTAKFSLSPSELEYGSWKVGSKLSPRESTKLGTELTVKRAN